MARTRNDELAVEVYLAHKADPDLPVSHLAARFEIAHSTARRYVEAGRIADQWVPAFDRLEMAGAVQAALLEILQASSEDATAAEDGNERAKHRTVAIAVIDRLIRLHGLAAPTRVQIEDVPKPPDPAFIEGIRQARLRGDRELKADLDPNDPLNGNGKRY